MANEVEITVSARDLSGPAFASVEGRIAKLRAEAKLLGNDLSKMSVGNIDVNKIGPALAALRAKIQALGIADIADVNVPLGRLTVQMQILKRLIQQAGISDLLGFNLNTSQLEGQISKIKGMSETIPVTWDVSALSLPKLGPTENIGRLMTESDLAGLQEGINKLSILNGTMMTSARDAAESRDRFMSLVLAIGNASAASKILDGSLMKQMVDQKAANVATADSALGTYLLRNSIAGLTDSLGKSNAAYDSAHAAVDELGLAAFTVGSRFWFLRGRVGLFAGALASVPFFGAVSGFHIVADAIIETAAVLIPAGAAFIAFGAGATGTIMDISRSMMALWNTTHALNQNIYPLTGSMFRLEKAVAPEVWNLFGQALIVINSKTSEFMTIAEGASRVVEQLGARTAAALTSGGLNAFMKNSVQDLAVIGDVVGNIFGTVGNLLKTMPGYAQLLLGVLDEVTKGLEAVTASPITQWIIKFGLYFHGAVLYLGLATTASVLFGNALLGLAARFGLVSAGMTVFDAAMFGIGIKQMLSGVGLLAGELVTLGAGEDIAAAGATIMEGAFIALDAVNPLVWIGLAAAALGGLIFMITHAASATNAYDTAVKSALQNAPVSQLSIDLARQQVNTIDLLGQAEYKLGRTQEQVNAINLHTGAIMKVTNPTWEQQRAIAAGYQGELSTLKGYQENYSTLLKAAGGNLSFLNDAGITSNQIIGASSNQMKQYVIEVKAAADAQKALGLGIGRAAAAQNAQTNVFMQETVPAMQKVNTAEDNLLNVILAGPQAFIAFQQSIHTTATAAKVAGVSIAGLGSAGLTLASDFYTTLVPAAQKLIDSLDQQSISTSNLTKVVATEAKQMLPLTQGNVEARSVIVDLINNALGPGTVSLKNLNTWIGNNSTSLKGFNSIVAKSAIAAGSLANVLQKDLNTQFQADLLNSSGATAQMKLFTNAIVNGGTSTDAYHSARQKLIQDLISTGMNATQAKNYVNNLQKQIDAMHGKTVNVGVHGTGSGSVTISGGRLPGMSATTAHLVISGAATGGKLPGFGGGDRHLRLLESGEAIVDKDRTQKYAHLLKMMGVPGMASGGVVGIQGMPGWADTQEADYTGGSEYSWANSVIKAIQAQLAKAAAASSGAVGGSSSANAALARHMYPSLSPQVWAAWNYVAMRESGWNRFARNPSSGAYGIPQALPPTKMPFAAQAAGGSHAGPQISWMWDYMASRYGGPIGAAAHEASQGWYDDGGWLQPGPNIMWNGTGKPEFLTPSSPGTSSVSLQVDPAGSTAFEQFMVMAIRNWVRTKGGGDVQKTFGKN